MAQHSQAAGAQHAETPIGIADYSVLESGQRIGRIRLVTERMPCVWPWSVTIHLGGRLPMGSSKDL